MQIVCTDRMAKLLTKSNFFKTLEDEGLKFYGVVLDYRSEPVTIIFESDEEEELYYNAIANWNMEYEKEFYYEYGMDIEEESDYNYIKNIPGDYIRVMDSFIEKTTSEELKNME